MDVNTAVPSELMFVLIDSYTYVPFTSMMCQVALLKP
jgi:hypothetical protein